MSRSYPARPQQWENRVKGRPCWLRSESGIVHRATRARTLRPAASGYSRPVLQMSRRRGSAIDDLIDGVNRLFFASSAAKNEDTGDEMKGAVIALVLVLRGRFLAHY